MNAVYKLTVVVSAVEKAMATFLLTKVVVVTETAAIVLLTSRVTATEVNDATAMFLLTCLVNVNVVSREALTSFPTVLLRDVEDANEVVITFPT